MGPWSTRATFIPALIPRETMIIPAPEPTTMTSYFFIR
ncbi:MAG: hypothetical protein A4E51_02069 [Methanosaeta sp. PtaU1.Bin055]|nr:MAG: hypothetical protein A4E51_02069 [Methanosaeta sp. PtaU1.Bin055]